MKIAGFHLALSFLMNEPSYFININHSYLASFKKIFLRFFKRVLANNKRKIEGVLIKRKNLT
jgi:hypothetical protein